MSFPNRKSTWSSWDTLPVADTTAIVKWSVDDTKLVRIEADGLTTWTTRVITMPDEDITLIDAASTKTLTNTTIDANWTGNSISNIDVADLANGTDWELITWDAAWAPATVAAWTATHVLTSNGAWAAPTFQAAGGGGTSYPLNIYESAPTTWVDNWIITFTHNLGLTQADVEAGKYKVFLASKINAGILIATYASGQQFWDVYWSTAAWWWANGALAINIWDSGDPANTQQVRHQANSLKIKTWTFGDDMTFVLVIQEVFN